MAARTLNVIFGIWLFISAFAWQHTTVEFTNTWVLGVLCMIFALIAMRVPEVRYLNTLLAIWLFISAFALSHGNTATQWNNCLLAIAVFIVSLVPSEVGARMFSARRATA